MGYSIGQVAKLAHISVRTLHYYDQIGLLHPQEQTRTGHRRYTTADINHLGLILCYRQIGMPLDQIHRLLTDPRNDPLVHLQRQRTWLLQRIEEFQTMAKTITTLIEARKFGLELTPSEVVDAFQTAPLGEYHDEAQQQWETTSAWKEAQHRTSTYTKDQWQQIQQESDALLERLVALQVAGVEPESVSAMEVAEAQRQHLIRWFYPCSYGMHGQLALLYGEDARFAARYEALAPHLASYLRDAITANVQRHTHAVQGERI